MVTERKRRRAGFVAIGRRTTLFYRVRGVDAYCWQPLNFDGLVQSRELGLHLPDVNSNMSGLLASWNTG